MTLLKLENIPELLSEVRIQRELAGAGGAPDIYGVSLEPARVFMSYTGKTYDTYINSCTQRELIESLIFVASRLQEIHDHGFVHTDLKNKQYNSRKIGNILIFSGKSGRRPWYAPELYEGVPLTPACDVYSFGEVIGTVTKKVSDDEVIWDLIMLQAEIQDDSPTARPSLDTVITKLRFIVESHY
ncbi:mitogen-activated protein kinase kinase kinase 20-like [Panulirus ornatus]|uniref:mitogen-activated protein kinase kinase kinase 20-like n=1 Tax=Panulirus ornatus TaxID=150431 RepID=UPI003A861631